MLKSWCGDRKAFSWGQPPPDRRVELARHMLAYWRYCRDFVATGRQRADDFTSELLAAHEDHPDDLTYVEVESIVYGLSFADHEAVTALSGNALRCLLPRATSGEPTHADRRLIRGRLTAD